jgi:NADH:ubiquinone oxidoreductase subunit C
MFFKKENLLNYSNYLKNTINLKGLRINIINNNIFIVINYKFVHILLNYLKNHTNLNFNCLVDILGNDLIYQKKRFNVIYSLLNCFLNYRFFVKISVEKFTKINSVVNLFSSAN